MSSDKDLIQESLQLFLKGLHSSAPLRHFSEHKDEAKLREAAQEECDKALVHFTRKLKASKLSMTRRGSLLSEFCLELDKLTEQHVTKNQDFKFQSESFLQKRVEVCYEDFESSINAKLLMNPDMDLKAVEDFFERGKPKATDYFEHLWKHGNVGGFEQQKTDLGQKLDSLKKEIVEKQTRVLEIKEEENSRKLLKEFEEIVLAVTRQVKYDISTLDVDGKINKDALKEKARGIYDTLGSKGKVVREKHGELHMQLLKLLEDSIELDDITVEDIAVDDAAEWAEKLIVQLQSRFVEHLGHMGKGLGMSTNEIPSSPTTKEVAIGVQVGPEDCLTNDDGVTLGIGIGTKRTHQEVQSVIVAPTGPPTPKRLRQVGQHDLQVMEETLSKASHDSREEDTSSCDEDDVNPLNIPDMNGKFPLLRALLKGRSVECVAKMLDDGVNVNIKGKDSFEFNAVHAVINALIDKQQTPTEALAILNLLSARGFNLINDCCSEGFTPLLFAMQYEGLNEDILSWFYQNGADFNAVTAKCGNSVIFKAISHRHTESIIKKIIDFGGNPKHVNKTKSNSLHMSAGFANESALEFFIDKFDVNIADQDGNSPLHLLFLEENLDHRYELCLETLLKKGADFAMKNEKGRVPLVSWMKFGRGNPFPTLIKMKDTLPITEEIASATLATIVQEIEKMQKFLPSSSHQSPPYEFVQFVLLLIGEKQAKLWRDETQWEKLDKDKKGRGEIVRVATQNLGQHELDANSSSVSVPIVTILACLLACKSYQGFVEVCRFVVTLLRH